MKLCAWHDVPNHTGTGSCRLLMPPTITQPWEGAVPTNLRVRAVASSGSPQYPALVNHRIGRHTADTEVILRE